jgi:hypothetical protein
MRFEGMKFDERAGTISYKGQGGPISGARATVETEGDLRRGARFLTTALIDDTSTIFGAKRLLSRRRLFLTIEGPGYGWVIKLDGKEAKAVHNFAARFNAAASPSAPVGGPQAAPQMSHPTVLQPLAQSTQEVSTIGRWADDPWGRFPHRWWDGKRWTEWVSSGDGSQQKDSPSDR